MSGTIRNFNPEIWAIMLDRIEKIVAGITKAMGGDYEFKYERAVPVTMNDIVSKVMEKVLGDGFIAEIMANSVIEFLNA
jgi:metal-dependent amidase/aminoacylase/carboxypeptidase family protein